jgi:nucleoside-diphosphate-sugar epimerase
LEGAKNVLYFTHDYSSNAADKNTFIQATAKLSKKVGVEKLVAVCPIEHDLYYSEDKYTPFDKKKEAQTKALSEFSNTVILNPNLVFGDNAYFVRYLIQGILAGRLPKTFLNSKAKYGFSPIYEDDLAKAVETAFAKLPEAKGQAYSVYGTEELTINNLVVALEQACNKEKLSTGSSSRLFTLGISRVLDEFLVG